MAKNLRKFKASFVGLIILASIFVMIASSFPVSAAAIERGTIIVIEQKGNTNLTLFPGNPVIFDFDVTYSLTPFLGGSGILYIPPTTVHLDVTGDEEDWIAATPDRSTLQMKPDEPQRVTLTVSVTPEAPYIRKHEIKITATADAGRINWAPSTSDIIVTVTPEFLYYLDADKEVDVAVIGPGETYSFPILLDNDASYGVKYHFEVEDMPKDWVISQPDSKTVSPKSEARVLLKVISPYDFGYHDQQVGFNVKVYAAPQPSAAGFEEEYVDTLSFTVRNRGFSLAFTGAGVFVFLFVIIAVIVVIMFFLRYKPQIGKPSEEKKTSEKKKTLEKKKK